MQSFLGIAEDECVGGSDLAMLKDVTPPQTESELPSDETETSAAAAISLVPLTPEEYFSNIDLNGRDVGRLPRTSQKVKYSFFFLTKILFLYTFDQFSGTTVQSKFMVKRTVSN